MCIRDSYNSRNQLIEIDYYGKDWELTSYNNDKYAIQKDEYDERGYICLLYTSDNCPFCPSSHSTRVLDDDTTTGKTQVLGGNMNAETDTIDPVSYTHLDVYKRQAMECITGIDHTHTGKTIKGYLQLTVGQSIYKAANDLYDQYVPVRKQKMCIRDSGIDVPHK